MDKERLTSHLRGDDELAIGAHIIDSAERAWQTNRPQITDFYDPYQVKVAKSVLDGIGEVASLFFGGYKRAERVRLVIYPQFYLTETIETPISVLEVTGNFQFQSVTHRDFLGAILGTGLTREKIGDLVCLQNGCQVVVAREVVDYLLQEWTGVHHVPVKIREIDEEQIAVEPERVKEIKCTVASLRLDAVASSGFGTSRTKMVRDIKGERVKVNWKIVNNPAQPIEQGTVISIRGRGRVVVEDVRGETKKGRISLLLKRLM